MRPAVHTSYNIVNAVQVDEVDEVVRNGAT